MPGCSSSHPVPFSLPQSGSGVPLGERKPSFPLFCSPAAHVQSASLSFLRSSVASLTRATAPPVGFFSPSLPPQQRPFFRRTKPPTRTSGRPARRRRRNLRNTATRPCCPWRMRCAAFLATHTNTRVYHPRERNRLFSSHDDDPAGAKATSIAPELKTCSFRPLALQLATAAVLPTQLRLRCFEKYFFPILVHRAKRGYRTTPTTRCTGCPLTSTAARTPASSLGW